MLTILICSLMMSLNGADTVTHHSASYQERCRVIAKEANIPLIQVVYKHGKKEISFESSQFDFIKESPSRTSVFQAASLSKPVFAYIVLRMVDRKEIDLDKPLYQYTGIERFKNKEWAKILTARMVLTHMTGLSNWSTSPSSEEWPTSDIEFKFRPDSSFRYSGEAFAFLQRAVEKIKGKSLEEIACSEVFRPLGMTHTSYEWRDEYDSTAVCGYNKEGVNHGQGRHPRANSAYTLRTTAEDYSRFLSALSTGKGLKPKTHREQFKPFVQAIRNENKVRECEKYVFWGLGVGIEKNPELGNIIFHWGDNGNFKALFVLIPKRFGHHSSQLVYFTNSAYGHDIIDKITKLFFNNKEPLKIDKWVNE